MENPYISSVVLDGETLDTLLSYLYTQYKFHSEPVGFKIENSSTDPTVQRIDRNGDDFDPDPDFFYTHELFIMPKVLLSTSGDVYYGGDRIGTGLDFTRSDTYAMVKCNNCKYKYWYEADGDTQFYVYAPFTSNYNGFNYHPHCYAGGRLNDHFFIGAYEAGLRDNNGVLQLTSQHGVQPITGGTINYLSFTSGGTTAFTVDETLTNAVTGATGIVVSYHLTSGSWAGGDAAGVVYLRQTTGTSGAGQLNGSVSGVDCATSSSTSTALYFTLDNALTYASNIGSGWTISDIHEFSLLRGLFYTQYGTRDSQSVVGKGVSELASSATGSYDGLLTGSNNIDSNVNSFGTGMGNGFNGKTPIRWNNIENLWGNIEEFLAGLNIFAADGPNYTAGSYRITDPNGNWNIAAILPEGSYITCDGTVPVYTTSEGGYISQVQHSDQISAITFIPLYVGDEYSSSSTYFCDSYRYATHNPSVGLSSGYWGGGSANGICFQEFRASSTWSYRWMGARLKYIPQS